MKTVLTIAGSDSSGGAGIQADIKTMTANGVYAMSAITALTAQNTMGVSGVYVVEPLFLKKQLESVFEDIVPDAVKIGMVSSKSLIEIIFEVLKKYKAENIVTDPVMISTSGSRLIDDDAIDCLKKLFSLSTLITPNIPEAEVLSGMKIKNSDDMILASKILNEQVKCSVLLKGGHSINDANDLLFENDKITWIKGERINNPNTHGTGCTLSSAIASNLAKGFSVEMSVKRAKEYVSGALNSMLDLGKGQGPLNHTFNIDGYFTFHKAQ